MSDNRMDKLIELLDWFEHECFMIRVEASETHAKDVDVRKAYERTRNEAAQAIAAAMTKTKQQLLIESLPFIEGMRDGSEWDEIAIDLAAKIKQALSEDEEDNRATERENGWYLRSDGYMTSKCNYQRIEAMKGNRALDNHGKLVFVKFMGGKEKDSRVYVPFPRKCKPVETEVITYYDEYGHDAVKVHIMECDRCGGTYEHVHGDYERCPRCGGWLQQ